MRDVSIQEVAHKFGIALESQVKVLGYQIDSRLIKEGDLFFALPGEKVDGHRFLKEVKEKGGVAAVVEKSYQGPDYGLILLPVEDAIKHLHLLAEQFMKECKATIIGITGSVGKTTTRDFTATLLQGKYRVGKTERNYNTKLTYPLTLLNRSGKEEVLVLELGMSEPGDISKLVEIAAPEIALVTKIAPAHLRSFEGGLAEIAYYKADIFRSSKVKKCIFDYGLYQFPDAFDRVTAEKISFSLHERSADYFLSDTFFVDERGVRAYQFHPLYQQPHLLHDFLAAVSIARQMNLQWDEINQEMAKLELPKMRFEQFELEGVTFINDAYNANPDSMQAALTALPFPKEGGKTIAVLGMMAELGKEHEMQHQQMGYLALRHVDHLLSFGAEVEPLFKAFQEGKKPAEHYWKLSSLVERLKKLMRPGDVVLVKAARVVELERLFSLL